MSRVDRWDRRTAIPLLLLAAIFFVAYLWPTGAPGSHPNTETTATIVTSVVWIVFVIDYVIRLILVERHQRTRYILTHWYDIAIIIIPALRGLLLLRFFTRFWAGFSDGRIAVYAAGTSLLLILIGAKAVLNAELTSPEANITTYGNAVWWAIVTVSTVGYGDYYPVTTGGRVIATLLMIVGIGTISSATGVFAANLMKRLGNRHNVEQE